jgi:hypothetical protein
MRSPREKVVFESQTKWSCHDKEQSVADGDLGLQGLQPNLEIGQLVL